jgi:predicted HTH domain antitoxin
MHTLSIPYASDLLVTSGKSPKALEEELRFLLAVKLFELHRLSLGKAAKFCGMAKLRFMFELGRLKVPVINLDEDQIADELRDD